MRRIAKTLGFLMLITGVPAILACGVVFWPRIAFAIVLLGLVIMLVLLAWEMAS